MCCTFHSKPWVSCFQILSRRNVCMPYPPSTSVIRYLRLGAKSYVLTVYIIWKPRSSLSAIEGRCRCDLARLSLALPRWQSTWRPHATASDIIIYREAWSQWRALKVIEELFNVRMSRCALPHVLVTWLRLDRDTILFHHDTERGSASKKSYVYQATTRRQWRYTR